MLSVDVSVTNWIIGVLLKMIICGILVRVIVDGIRHVNWINILDTKSSKYIKCN